MSKRVSQLDMFASGFRTDSDVVVNGGSVEFYTADQSYSTPKNAYTTKDKTATLTSVTLDANGRYTSGLFFAGGEVYDFRLKDSAGATVRNYPNQKIPETTTSVRTETAATVTATIDDDVILCDTSSNAITVNLFPVADAVKGITIKNTGASNNNVTVDGNGSELIDGSATISLVDAEAQVLYSDGTQWRGQGVSSGSNGLLIDTQRFTASGTWTKPAGTNSVIVRALGGGGGGGGAEGSATGSLLRFGGGGAGGSYIEVRVSSGIGATETVTVGAGGAGAAAGDNSGTGGGDSSFGTHVTAGGGGGGSASGPSASQLGIAGVPQTNTALSSIILRDSIGSRGEYGFGDTDADTSTVNYYRTPWGGGSGLNGTTNYPFTTNEEGRVTRGQGSDGLDAQNDGQGGMGGAAFAVTSNEGGGAGRGGFVVVESYT